jgi:AcrR family transcriptional regulator
MLGRDSNFCPMKGRRERKREETRLRIFEHAMRLFAERGFTNTPVEEITEAADVAKGTFFNYFPTKEAILEALAERQISVLKAAEEKSRTAEQIRPVLVEMVHKLSERPSRSQLLLRSLIGVAMTNNTLSKFLAQVLEKGRGHITAIMQRAQDAGEIRRDMEPQELARILQHLIFGTHVIWAISKPSALALWIDKTFDVMWRGMAAEAIPAPIELSARKERLL